MGQIVNPTQPQRASIPSKFETILNTGTRYTHVLVSSTCFLTSYEPFHVLQFLFLISTNGPLDVFPCGAEMSPFLSKNELSLLVIAHEFPSQHFLMNMCINVAFVGTEGGWYECREMGRSPNFHS